jgi:hypothetical protein
MLKRIKKLWHTLFAKTRETIIWDGEEVPLPRRQRFSKRHKIPDFSEAFGEKAVARARRKAAP